MCTETAMVFFGPVPDGKQRHQDNEGKGSWLLERLLDIMSRVHENLRATKSHGSCCSMCGGLGGPCWWPYCSVKNGACDSTLVATPNGTKGCRPELGATGLQTESASPHGKDPKRSGDGAQRYSGRTWFHVLASTNKQANK